MRFSVPVTVIFSKTILAPFSFFAVASTYPIFRGDGGAELFKTLDMKIDGTRADGAAARKRNAGLARPCQQWTQYEHGSAHGLHQFVGRFMRSNGGCFQAGRASALEFHFGAQFLQKAASGENVIHHRDVFQNQFVGGQQRRGHCRERRVLRATDPDLSAEARASRDFQFVHYLFTVKSAFQKPAGLPRMFS